MWCGECELVCVSVCVCVCVCVCTYLVCCRVVYGKRTFLFEQIVLDTSATTTITTSTAIHHRTFPPTRGGTLQSSITFFTAANEFTLMILYLLGRRGTGCRKWWLFFDRSNRHGWWRGHRTHSRHRPPLSRTRFDTGLHSSVCPCLAFVIDDGAGVDTGVDHL